MSVFENAYFSKYKEAETAITEQSGNQDTVFLQIYLTTLINTFRWKGLPTMMPSFQMEKYMQLTGRVAYFRENGVDYLLPAFPVGALTTYGEFTEYAMITMNGNVMYKKKEDIELCYNNTFKTPYYYMVAHFADKSAHALTAVDGALDRATVGTIINCKDEDTAKQLSDLLDRNQCAKKFNVVYGEFTNANMERITAFDNKETDVLALFDVYTRYRNLFYSTFGINNVEIQKRERLTQAEGSGNDEIVRYSLLDDMYQNRIDFIERVKSHFGVELTVEVQRDVTTVFELSLDNEDKVHNAEIEITKGANLQNPANEDVDSTKGDTDETNS